MLAVILIPKRRTGGKQIKKRRQHGFQVWFRPAVSQRFHGQRVAVQHERSESHFASGLAAQHTAVEAHMFVRSA